MKILIPKPDSWYLKIQGYRVGEPEVQGPFHDSGDPWQVVNFSKDELNNFSQGAKLYGESSLYHRKVDGNIYINPGLLSGTPTGNKNVYTGRQLYRYVFKSGSGSTLSVTMDPTLILNQSDNFSYTLYGDLSCVSISRNGNGFRRVGASSGPSMNSNKKYNWLLSGAVIEVLSTTSTSARYLNAVISSGYPRVYTDKRDEATGMAAAQQFTFSGEPNGSVYTGTKYYLEEQDFSMSKIRQWIHRALQPELFSNLPSLDLDDWGDLVHHAAGNLDALSANMIAFVKDLKDIKSLVPKLRELGKLKTHAGNYLAYQYGVLPTISDLKAIWEAFSPVKYYNRSGYRRVSAYDSTSSSFEFMGQTTSIYHTRRAHLAINESDTGLDALVEKVRNYGLFPSLTNIWDLIPYSFVLDWFIDVGSVLERIDTRHRLLNLDIPYVILSDKLEFSFSLSDLEQGIGSSITVTSYNRNVTRSVPQPRIFGEINKPPTVQNHWIEGSALILQRTK